MGIFACEIGFVEGDHFGVRLFDRRGD